jgi:hypothetical protein
MNKLFQVEIRVRPTPEHSLFEQIGFGILFFWLYAHDKKTALKNGILIGIMHFTNNRPFPARKRSIICEVHNPD